MLNHGEDARGSTPVDRHDHTDESNSIKTIKRHHRKFSFSDLESNPARLGLPKRIPSITKLVEQFVDEHNGRLAINSVLVANNGLGAVKFIRSIRSWAFETFGNSKAIGLVAMATPEDIRINAEHIQLADQFVEVPGNTTNNNYANVRLIVHIAERAGVDAVWPGWGHASENPELPASLAEKGICFLGPPSVAMAALGDKIGSTILAQAAGVPTLPWSGTGVAVSFADCGGHIPDDVYSQACIHSVGDALEACRKIGYPLMLKASWGGGGKGIRKVLNDDEVRLMFPQIQGEVPGSPIFAMKLAPASRHLEVQLMCDAHGNVTSLFGRDCSVQRRHQKIVEEGPVVAASRQAQEEMEKCARGLARSVGYVGVATVEFLYCIEENRFYFLELNPRLQVEHPVTEGITAVNIPSCQLMVGMGIPLWRIPSIRALYGQDPRGLEAFDLETTPQKLPDCHVVAVRVTSEDANEGFKPTSGRIDDLHFRPTPEVWGYFSVKSGGGIHEFSDSQFGHLFAKGETREAAIRAMVVALQNVTVRGEVRTIIDYVSDMLQGPDFLNNNIHTGWLDGRIASKVQAQSVPWYLGVIAGAVIRAMQRVTKCSAEYLGYLEKGQLPPPNVLLTHFVKELVIEGFKYPVDVTLRGPQIYNVALNASNVDVVARKLNDGGYLLQVDGQSHVVHVEEEALGTRLAIGSLTCLIANEVDPSRLLAISPGKLVRYIVEQGSQVTINQPYAEVEVMKMMMPLLTPASGRIHFQLPEGSTLSTGDCIATMQLDDPAAVTRAVYFNGNLPELGPPLVHSARVDHRFKAAFESAKHVMAGYIHPVDSVVDELVSALDSPGLGLLQWGEQFAVLSTRLPPALTTRLEAVMRVYETELSALTEAPLVLEGLMEFPAQELVEIMEAALSSTTNGEFRELSSTLEPLLLLARRHTGGKEGYARAVVQELLEDFLVVEETFQPKGTLTTEQEIIQSLRQIHKGSLSDVLAMVISHQGLATKAQMVKRIIQVLVVPGPIPYRPYLRRMTTLALTSHAAADLAQRAQQLLEHSLLADLRAVVARALSGLEMFSLESPSPATASVPGQNPVVRRVTMKEGLFSGLGSLIGLKSPSASPFTGAMNSSQVETKMAMLVEAPAAVEEPLASLIVDHSDPLLQSRAMSTYIRRIYQPFLLHDPELLWEDGLPAAVWMYDDPTWSNTPASRQLVGAMVLVPSLQHLAARLEWVTAHISARGWMGGAQVGNLHVAITGDGPLAMEISEAARQLLERVQPMLGEGVEEVSDVNEVDDSTLVSVDVLDIQRRKAAAVSEVTPQLLSLGVHTVSVLCKGPRLVPLRSAFQLQEASRTFYLNPFLKHVEPPMAAMMEVRKLQGRSLLYAPSRNRQWHLYTHTERTDPRSYALRRMYMRGVVRQLGHPALLAATYSGNSSAVAAAAVNELEEILVGCLDELLRIQQSSNDGARRCDWVHIFHSVLPVLPLNGSSDEDRVAATLRMATATIVARHAAALRKAAVAQYEIRLPVADQAGAWRVVVCSPTGHEHGEEHVEVYRERCTPPPSLSQPPRRVYSLPEGGNPREDAPGGLAGRDVLEAYPPLERLQQKRLAARRHHTTYCYDFPAVFEDALHDVWAERAATGEPSSAAPAGRLVDAVELTLLGDNPSFREAASLQRVKRAVGQNDCGMVAWLLSLKTPECPQGRNVVAVANDITFQSGAFGPIEDAMFRAATELALTEKLPLLYLAANSGARVGLATEVKECLQVQWIDDDDPSKGMAYLYLDDSDYQRLMSKSSTSPPVVAEPATRPDGSCVWRLTGVIGLEDGLGVENLSGSAAIASAFCRAFREGLTMTLVTGRTVGIGAYLARLGRRCIQRQDQPIILTGYAALNKLLGRQVYSSHMQLGGPRVMGSNGVSHHVVADDLEGVNAMLRWLSYTPLEVGGIPPALASNDPVDRRVEYCPAANEKLDPRAAIAGIESGAAGSKGSGSWTGGLFDHGSWTEAHTGWARTVVTGRARLGGIPVGVIGVETQTVLHSIPADPGAPESSEQTIPQAGQVWFPDSASKTAMAMEEMNLEGLPLFVLANWRGFSGGQRDLFEGVLQAGSLIVEELRTYRQPVFVYVPTGGEIRGGAWVVIDSQINSSMGEMWCDPTARGGVLEPEGLCEIKFRNADLLKTMHRLDPVIQQLKAEGGSTSDAEIRARESLLLPVYQQVALQFADLHDTPARMEAKGVVRGIVPWAQSRCFFAIRLRKRLMEETYLHHIASADGAMTRAAAEQLLGSWYASFQSATWQVPSPSSPTGPQMVNGHSTPKQELNPLMHTPHHTQQQEAGYEVQMREDSLFLKWAESGAGRATVARELKKLRSNAARRVVGDLVRTGEGKEGLLRAVAEALQTDPSFALQLRNLTMTYQQQQQQNNSGHLHRKLFADGRA